MLKKTIRRLGALAMVLAMAVSVFAVNASATDAEASPAPAMKKDLQITNEGTSINGETFMFNVEFNRMGDKTKYTTNPQEGAVTATNAVYDSGVSGEKPFELHIDKGKFPGPGEYYFKITEKQGTTAGMNYSTQEKMLVVHIYSGTTTPTYYIIANNGEAKNDGKFTNIYNAAKSLKIHKNVTGTMGNKDKTFRAKVTFTAPTGKTVNSTIVYGEETIAPDKWSADANGNLTVSVWVDLKDGNDVKNDIEFVNVPYGVTCTVEEDDYSSEGYDDPEYSANNGGAVDAAAMTVTVTNNKNATTPGGVIMTIAPYALMLVVAGAFAVVFLSRRNRAE